MPNESGEAPKERRKIKMISANQFVWIDYERASGKVMAMAGGSCELKGSQYTEKVEFASKDVESIIGKTFVFDIKLVHNQLLQSGNIGEDTKLEETWRKSDATPPVALVSQAKAEAKK